MARSLKADVLGAALGTAAALDAGISPGNLVQVQAGGKLPALDGSLLTGVSGSGGSATRRIVRFKKTANQGVAYNAPYLSGRVTWDAVVYNDTGSTDAAIWTAADPSRITVPPGMTRARFKWELPIDYTGNYRNLGLQKNGADWWSRGGMSIATDHEIADTQFFAVTPGDYFHACLYTQRGGGETIYAGVVSEATGCILEVEFI